MKKIDFYLMLQIYMLMYVNYLVKKDLEEIQKSNQEIAAMLVTALQTQALLHVKKTRPELWRKLLPAIREKIVAASFITYKAKREIIGYKPNTATSKNEFTVGFFNEPVMGSSINEIFESFVKTDVIKTSAGVSVAKMTGERVVSNTPASYATTVQTIATAGLSYATNRAYNEGRKVKEIFVAVLDNRTTDLCRGLNGSLFERDTGPMPPLHWRCRSRRVPFEGDAYVPTYAEFVRGLPIQFQQDILGSKIDSASLDSFIDYREKEGDYLITSIDDFQEKIDNLTTYYIEENS